MVPGNQDNPSVDRVNDLESKSGSFHGKLLDRGQTCLPVRKRDRLAKLSRRANWLGVLAWLGWFVGQGAILAGGLALGAGIMKQRFENSWPISESRSQVTNTVLVAGVGSLVVGVVCILASILMRQVAKPGSGPVARAVGAEARGAVGNPG